ncbi:MAG TPA: flagellar export chaperone FliS [Candidatus Angelobacter sp.]|nr:flagellar export chaperone FliS [Candidatus Angelobacter sp.]
MTNPASEYRKRAVEGASPVGLVVLLYGGMITAFMRAIAAIEANNIEKRVLELNKVLAILAELQGTLDFEKGGAVAEQLEKFYVVMRSRVLEASIKNSKPILEELVKITSGIKEAWQQVERENAINGVSGVAAPPQPVTSVSRTPMAAAF